jgi:hypothetical protein
MKTNAAIKAMKNLVQFMDAVLRQLVQRVDPKDGG